MSLWLLLAAGCSTGIESTKKIQMSRSEQKQMIRSEEQTFADSIKGTPLSQWQKGKKFMASSGRTPLIFEPSGVEYASDYASFEGKILRFAGTESKLTPDLNEECVIVFTDGNQIYRYHTGKTSEAAMQDTYSSKLPLLYDLDLIETWKNKISGLTVWTRSSLWYDSSGNRIPGLKFAKAGITDVTPSSGTFPMKVQIMLPDGETAYLNMNYTTDTADSRNFAAIFFLKDPKSKYPNITPENWELIQKGKIRIGMTKEECRLSLGNPDDVDAGKTTSQTMDIWKYGDGIYLMFTDGLLSRFRQ